MKTVLIIAIALVLAAVSPFAFAQSGEKGNTGSLYQGVSSSPWQDNVARKVGDLLTVIVKEESIATYEAATTATKKDKNGISVDFFNNFLNGILRPFTTGSDSSTSGSGDTEFRSRMSSRLSVIVKEVVGNGYLVVEGTRTLVTNKETQTIVFSGVVRPTDIRPDNTVDSTKVAEAQVKMAGKGTIQDRQRKGILTQVLDWLF